MAKLDDLDQECMEAIKSARNQISFRPGVELVRLMASSPAATPIPQQKNTLENLLPELQLSIFDHLDTKDSVCVGLTSKKFYTIHKSIHGKALLTEDDGPGPQLHQLLIGWMGYGINFYPADSKFLKPKTILLKLGDAIEQERVKMRHHAQQLEILEEEMLLARTALLEMRTLFNVVQERVRQ